MRPTPSRLLLSVALAAGLLVVGCSPTDVDPREEGFEPSGGGAPWSEEDPGGWGLRPPAPTGVAASDGDYADRVVLSWRPVEGADRYCIQRSDDPRGDFGRVGDVRGGEASWEDTDAEPGVAYWYSVEARSGNEASARSEADPGFAAVAPLPDGAPEPPTGLEVSPLTDPEGDEGFFLLWRLSAGATSYRVERRADVEVDWQTVATRELSAGWVGPVATDPGPSPGRRFAYRVVAASSWGESAPGEPVEAALDPIEGPCCVEGVVEADGSVALTWGGVVNATGYTVTRGQGSGERFDTVVARTGGTHVQDVDLPATLPGGQGTFHYRVRAHGPFGASGWSDVVEVEVSRPEPPPTAPTGVEVLAVSSTEAVVRWDPVARTRLYRVWARAADIGGKLEVLRRLEPAVATVAPLAPGTRYEVRITALGLDGQESGLSAAVELRTLLPAPPQMEIVSATTDGVDLRWTNVPGAAGFVIQRSPACGAPREDVGYTASWTFRDATAPLGVPFWYQVAALDGEGRQGAAHFACDEAHRAFRPFPPPQDVTAARAEPGSGSRLVVRWQPVAGAPAHVVSHATDPDGPYSQGAVVPADQAPEARLAALDAATVYFVRVAAENGIPSEPAVVMTAPDAPSSVGATADLVGAVELGWAPAAGAVRYVVRRASEDDGPAYQEIGQTDQTAFVDSDAPLGRALFYTVEAFSDDLGFGVIASGPSTAATGMSRELAPTPWLDATESLDGVVDVSWPAVDGAVAYDVYRAVREQGPFELLQPRVEGLGVTDADVETQMIYWYAVAAVDAYGHEGRLGAQHRGVALGPYTLEAPNALHASRGTVDGVVRVQWPNVPGAAQYRVFRAQGDAPYAPFQVVAGTAIADADVVAGVQYGYFVRAMRADGHESAAKSPLAQGWPR